MNDIELKPSIEDKFLEKIEKLATENALFRHSLEMIQKELNAYLYFHFDISKSVEYMLAIVNNALEGKDD